MSATARLDEAPPEVQKEIVADSVRRLLRRMPEARETLTKILLFEHSCMKLSAEEREEQGLHGGCCWAWWEPRITNPKLIDILLEANIITPCGRRRPGDKRSPLAYRLASPEAVAEVLGINVDRIDGGPPTEAARRAVELAEKARRGCTFELDEDVFDSIVGLDKVKKWIRRALCARQPTHVLLYGATGTAKTMMLELVYKNLKQKGYPVKMVYVSRAGTTGQGLLEALISLPEYPTPSVLIIDEMDKIRDTKLLDILAHAMEHQRFTVLKHDIDEEYERNVWVLATANRVDHLPEHLWDRFSFRFYFRPYTREEYVKVVPMILTKLYGVEEDLARYIAERLAEAGITSVREAREIAKVVTSKEEVDEYIEDFVVKRPKNLAPPPAYLPPRRRRW